MKKLQRGILISFEGIDGSGKTLLATTVYQMLKAHVYPVLLTKEPGGSELGKLIRTIVQEYTGALSPKAEYLLYAADRAQHFEERILPALATNSLVLSDRLADSSLAYQGYGRGLDLAVITHINQWVMNGRQPDLTFYVRVDVDTSFERMKKRNEKLTRFEQEKKLFFQRLIEGYNTIFANRSNVITLDGHQEPAVLAEQTMAFLIDWLKEHDVLR